MRFLKYQIPNKAVSKIVINSPHVILGELLTGFTAIDVLWVDDADETLNNYLVYPQGIGNHTFAGCEELYQLEYDNYINK